MYDVVIIGAGIVGSFLAYDLAKYSLNVLVIDKENDVANGATMANSAIIHSGHDPKDGTLKALLNVKGSRMYKEICKKLACDYQACGAFVVACNDEDEVELQRLYNNAINREIPVQILDREEALLREPNLTDNTKRVLYLPTTAIIYPWEVAIALMEYAMANGVSLRLNTVCEGIDKNDQGFVVKTNKGEFSTKFVINCAGVYADKIYQMVSSQVDWQITPRRGEYYVLDKKVGRFVRRVIYPIPSASGKGVLVVPTTHGNFLVGPNSEVIKDKEGNNNTESGLAYVKSQILKSVKQIPYNKVIRIFSGLRPSGTTGDFIIEEAKDVENFINVAAIESPGLASAPAISEYTINNILFKKISPSLKKDLIEPKKYPRLLSMSLNERNALIKDNPQYGHIICRCEQISEGEIVDSINRLCGARSVKAVKKRVRPGMGRCQGGFCEPRVLEILARELKCSPLEVVEDQTDSFILTKTTKENTHDK